MQSASTLKMILSSHQSECDEEELEYVCVCDRDETPDQGVQDGDDGGDDDGSRPFEAKDNLGEKRKHLQWYFYLCSSPI